jgi:hypothetical protein
MASLESAASILDRFCPNVSPAPVDTKIHMASIGNGNVAIVSKDAPTAINSKPVGYSTEFHRSGPLIIYGKRWYFRLVPRKAGEKTARGLMEDYRISDLLQHLVVCFTPDRIPGQAKPFRKPDGSPGRIFAYFDSYAEFYAYQIRFPLSEWSFYEMIFGELPQKPHFDIDISNEALQEYYPGEELSHTALLVRDAVITGCIQVLSEINVQVDIARDILIYDSHSTVKRSFHLVINNKCHDGNKEAKAFYEAVMKKVAVITNGKYLDFVDKSVYSPRQQFRIVLSQKQNSNRPKMFNDIFDYNGLRYTHIYTEPITDDKMKYIVQLYESLTTFVSGCSFIPSLIPHKTMSSANLSELTTLEDSMVEQCMLMLKQKMNPCPFSVKEVNGHVIILKREAPSMCVTCHRIHQAENPYLFVIGGKVYWDCRRANDDVKKFFVGFVTFTMDELRTTQFDQSMIETDTSLPEEGEEMNFGDFVMPGMPSATNKPLTSPKLTSTSVGSVPVTIPQINSTSSIPSTGPTILSSIPPVEQRTQNPHLEVLKLAQDRARQKYNRTNVYDTSGRFASVNDNTLTMVVQPNPDSKFKLPIIPDMPWNAGLGFK